MSEKITWKSSFSYGKYKGEQLLTVFIKDKDYIRWSIENEVDRDEIHFIMEEMTASEKKQMKLDEIC